MRGARGSVHRFRLGFVANFISDPVLVGFKAGVGLVILVDQAPKLLGVHFDGHTEMTRILMPDEWIGAPLRKDAPGARIPVTFKGDGGAR